MSSVFTATNFQKDSKVHSFGLDINLIDPGKPAYLYNMKQATEKFVAPITKLSDYTARPLSELKLHEIAVIISKDWKKVTKDGKVHPYAKPYVEAMMSCETLDSRYIVEDGRTQVIYFLSNASYWKGAVAKEVKLYLNKILKG